ncbi:MAG: AMP-binding protein [Thermoplasmatales archaeon]|nr:MAG: AMP-binding protein [Thermoplasmatales archaeon]
MLVSDFLEESAQRFPRKTALIHQSRRLTFIEIENAANSIANALIHHDLQRQERVAIYLENSVESVLSIFGILKASGIFVVINSLSKKKKVEYIVNDCQVTTLITDTRHLEEISDILYNCPHLSSVIITDKGKHVNSFKHLHPKIFSFYDALSNYPTTRPLNHCIDIDLASLIYTSGSTGNPKGVMLTHLNMVSAATSIIEYLENTSDDIIINCLPLSFDYGLYQILMAFKFGGAVVLERSFLYPYQIIDLIMKENVTGFPIVPTIAAILLRLKNLHKYDFSSLRYITNTAQALPPKHIARLQELFPHTKIYSMYGLTECKRVSYLPPEELSKRPTSVGKAMPNTEAYIVNEKGEKISKPGEIGELVVRGANVMMGYWNLSDETAMVLRPGSYPGTRVLYTGDLFKMDNQGFLYFIARKDDIIKTAGEKVSPKEIENILYEIEDVIEAAVIGVPDEILGQAIKAVVAVVKDSKLTEKNIIQHCSKHLENFMVPKYVEIRQKLPKTSTGKIRKKDLM